MENLPDASVVLENAAAALGELIFGSGR